ncbi:MAG: alpha/beta fold hydrolase [Candidatus Sungbacteria bacterium]|nr:alpha/beta fold hydrolase [bacterium]MDZ4260215.1 alpha/beta fold hydrolase [Candidatus Sungbacteria bacterium]
MIKRKHFSLYSPRFLVMIAIGTSAFLMGIFFALPLYRKDFARLDFSHVSVMAEIVDTPESRTKGLSGRASLGAREGMLFVLEKPDYIGIWMKQMRFPIDILWIKNGMVVDMEEAVRPLSLGASDDELIVYRPDVPADLVLEVVSDFSRSHDIHIGDRVNIQMRGKTYAYAYNNESQETHMTSITPSVPPAGHEYFIETLRKEALRGADFSMGKKIATSRYYDTYHVSYTSDDLIISGVMNVPNVIPPKNGFPVLVLNHGLIPADMYVTGRGSKREQDFFAKNGYITIHPDYRGLGSSSPDMATHHDFYVGYSQDVVSLLDAIERAALPFMDISRIGMWGHSMGGGIAARIMVLRPEVKAFVLFAPISADVEDNFYELTQEEIDWLHSTYGPQGDLAYRNMSPLEYFSDVVSPVQIHHGTGDEAVPISFSEKMYESLEKNQKNAELFLYPRQKHEFIEDWPLAAHRALQFFDRYVKAE